MRKWRFQRGELPVGCIVGLVILVIAVMITIKLVPIQMRMGDFTKEVRDLADRANRVEYNDKLIMQRILAKARDLEFPVTEKDVVIKRGDARIIITVEFTKEVDFVVYTYVWNKVIQEDRPLF